MLAGSFDDQKRDTNKTPVPRSNQVNGRRSSEGVKQVPPIARTTPCQSFRSDDYRLIETMVSFVKSTHGLSAAFDCQ